MVRLLPSRKSSTTDHGSSSSSSSSCSCFGGGGGSNNRRKRNRSSAVGEGSSSSSSSSLRKNKKKFLVALVMTTTGFLLVGAMIVVSQLETKRYLKSVKTSSGWKRFYNITTMASLSLVSGTEASSDGDTNNTSSATTSLDTVSSSSSFVKYYNQIHSTDKAILDLLDWEKASLHGLQPQASLSQVASNAWYSCQPPNGISKTCCLGSFSSGGDVDFRYRHHCSNAFFGETNRQWEQLQQQVHRFMEEQNPLPPQPPPSATTRSSSSSSAITNWNMQCDACQIIELARQHSLNISMIGDSMQSQILEGIMCELQRRGYLVKRQSRLPNCGIGKRCSTFQDFHTHVYLQVTSPTWANNHNNKNESDDEVFVPINYHMLYKFPLNDGSKPVMEEILSKSQVLILGMGLHWKYGNRRPTRDGDLDDYAREMGQVFYQAFSSSAQKEGSPSSSSSSSVELLVQRETTAQHFDFPGGDYVEWKAAKQYTNTTTTDQCTNRIGAATYWREKALNDPLPQTTYHYKRIMVEAGMMPPPPSRRPDHDKNNNNNNGREVLTLPYHNFTQLFHKMHPTHEDNAVPDCTHYCSSPYLYMTLWRSLRLAMDRRFLLLSN